jgi:TM2 domain-containing membrane protein YozV
MPEEKSDFQSNATFLYVFFGITPFGVFGIHDFIIGEKRRGLIHLLLFGVSVFFVMMYPTLTTMTSFGITWLYDLIASMGTDPYVFLQNAASYATMVSYIMSFGEVAFYLMRRREASPAVPESTPEKPEDPFTHDEEY